MKFTIDESFKALMRPLGDEERAMLEASIVSEGCRQPLVVWGDTGILLDGHNRYNICEKHNIAYDVHTLWLGTNRQAAEDWIVDNQLGRRNLTQEEMKYFLGKKYLREKQQGVEQDTERTSVALAEDYNLGEKTVRRYADRAKTIDRLGEVLGEDQRSQLVHGDHPILKTDADIKVARKLMDTFGDKEIVPVGRTYDPTSVRDLFKELRERAEANLSPEEFEEKFGDELNVEESEEGLINNIDDAIEAVTDWNLAVSLMLDTPDITTKINDNGRRALASWLVRLNEQENKLYALLNGEGDD